VVTVWTHGPYRDAYPNPGSDGLGVGCRDGCCLPGRSGRSLRAGVAFGALRPSWSGGSGVTLQTLRTRSPGGAGGSGGSGLVPGDLLVALSARRRFAGVDVHVIDRAGAAQAAFIDVGGRGGGQGDRGTAACEQCDDGAADQDAAGNSDACDGNSPGRSGEQARLRLCGYGPRNISGRSLIFSPLPP
jgi:hypothetical protein